MVSGMTGCPDSLDGHSALKVQYQLAVAINGQCGAGMEPLLYLLLEERPNLFQSLGIHLHTVGGYYH